MTPDHPESCGGNQEAKQEGSFMRRFIDKWLPKDRPIVIAEIGVNHNGDINLAKEMIDAAQASGADVAKFQTFVTEELVGRQVGLADYQARNLGRSISQYEMIKSLELTRDEMREVAGYCKRKGIEFLSSAGETDSVDFLCSLGVEAIKIGSGDLTNLPLLRYVARTGRAVLLSTGMGTLGEVESAVSTLQENGCGDIVLFHCTSNYPTPYQEVNLRAMQTMATSFGLPVGYSDHTVGYEIALGAVALGAVAIEKHFTLDENLPGPDHKASMTPEEFAAMVQAIEHLAVALGDGRKKPMPSEIAMRDSVRKSLVAGVRIPAGTAIAPEMISTMRVGEGLSPVLETLVFGARARRDICEGETLKLSMFDFSEGEEK